MNSDWSLEGRTIMAQLAYSALSTYLWAARKTLNPDDRRDLDHALGTLEGLAHP